MHDLKNLEDILKVVTPENIDNFLIDLGKEGIYNKHRTRNLHWIDDGKTDAKISVEFNPQE